MPRESRELTRISNDRDAFTRTRVTPAHRRFVLEVSCEIWAAGFDETGLSRVLGDRTEHRRNSDFRQNIHNLSYQWSDILKPSLLLAQTYVVLRRRFSSNSKAVAKLTDSQHRAQLSKLSARLRSFRARSAGKLRPRPAAWNRRICIAKTQPTNKRQPPNFSPMFQHSDLFALIRSVDSS